VSELRIDPVFDAEFMSLPTDGWFDWSGGRGVDAEDWGAHADLLVDGHLRFTVGAYLVRGGPVGDRVVLIDAGVGPETNPDDLIPPGVLPDSLVALGVGPHEITDIVITHLHYDHTGWLAPGGAPFFERATVHVPSADIAYFTDPASEGGSARVTPGRLAALGDRLRPFDAGETPVPGLDFVDAAGHTPGSTIVVASNGVRRVVFLGDVVHCPMQLVDADWAAMSDVDPVMARHTRERVVQELDGAEVGAAHFPGLQLGRLLVSERPRQWLVSREV
jgi:glyoxylase-like metal-dependent hydrolase (beta-lactamase superfamily II)